MQAQGTRGLATNPVADRILGMNLGRAFGTTAMTQAGGDHGDDHRGAVGMSPVVHDMDRSIDTPAWDGTLMPSPHREGLGIEHLDINVSSIFRACIEDMPCSKAFIVSVLGEDDDFQRVADSIRSSDSLDPDESDQRINDEASGWPAKIEDTLGAIQTVIIPRVQESIDNKLASIKDNIQSRIDDLIAEYVSTSTARGLFDDATPKSRPDPEHELYLSVMDQLGDIYTSILDNERDLASMQSEEHEISVQLKDTRGLIKAHVRKQVAAALVSDGSEISTDAGDELLNQMKQKCESLRALAKTLGEDSEMADKSIKAGYKSIQALLAKHYSVAQNVKLEAPMMDYRLTLSKSLTGASDPMETHSLHAAVKKMILSHPVQNWCLIPVLLREFAEVGRNTPTFDVPGIMNKYSHSVPACLSAVLANQSKILFAKLESSDYAAVHKSFFKSTHTVAGTNEKISIQAFKDDGISVLVWFRFHHEMSGYSERAKLRDFLHAAHGGFVKCGDPSKFISDKLERYIEKAKNLNIRVDYDATVKRIALVLKKRDPATFMTVCNEWDTCKTLLRRKMRWVPSKHSFPTSCTCAVNTMMSPRPSKF